MRISIQGEFGSFSHEAALNMEPLATILPCSFSPEAFKLVDDGDADAAVIPIENSLAGSVVEHFDLLWQSQLKIERESLLRIRHNLIAVPGARIEQISSVLSHPVALAQCRRLFHEHPHLTPTPFYDTAGSVKHILNQGLTHIAAIAGTQAARTYGGEVLAAGIEDNAANFTRFFLIRTPSHVRPPTTVNKVSIAFNVANRPGSLVDALRAFAEHDTNLCKIESRPVPGRPWEYVFYVDYQLSNPSAADIALEQLRKQCGYVKEFGRYQAASSLT